MLLSLGPGGAFDGIVLPQIQQSHTIQSGEGHPSDSLTKLRINTVS